MYMYVHQLLEHEWSIKTQELGLNNFCYYVSRGMLNSIHSLAHSLSQQISLANNFLGAAWALL